MQTKTKAQAGADLLTAIDTYIDTVIAEREQQRKLDREKQLHKYVKEHKNDAFHIPDDTRGPYAKYLRDNLK